MALTKCKKKQNLKESPEPADDKADRDKLSSEIQKDDVSHLHYDFRLEMEGVLVKGCLFYLKSRMLANPAMNFKKEKR